MTPQIHGFLGPKSRSGVIVAGVMGAVLLIAIAWAVILWTRPEPIRIAFASSLSGPSAPFGTESLVATQLAIDDVNAKGGVNGRPIELVPFDDESKPAVARANVQAIADSPCVAVLGHDLSSTSLAAGPAYKDARIPALTGGAAADDLTSGNEYYFRALSPVSAQGRSIAEHLRALMKEPKVHLVHTRDSYGKNFLRGFAAAYPTEQLRAFGLDVTPGRIGSMDEALDAAVQEPGPGIIVVGAATDFSADIVKALRRRGIKGTIVTPQGAAREGYLQNFANEPEEKAHPGFFSENLYAASSLIFDSAGGAAQVFAADYKAKAGASPSWVGGGAYDAARLMIGALKRAAVQNRSDSKVADRDRVRVALAAIDSPKSAVVGLTGRLYFNANRDIPRPIRMGFFHYGRFVTAPLQLVRIDQADGIDLDAEQEKGHIIAFEGARNWIQRVVYTGIDIIRVNRIDVKQISFNVDLYLWMRFAGDDEAQTHVEFPALLDRDAFDPARPLQTGREDGLNYRLYRINGDFKTRFELHGYPFELFFPETLFRERVTIPVTAILTSAVLLLAVDNKLCDVVYTVAVVKIFYVFFALCL